MHPAHFYEAVSVMRFHPDSRIVEAAYLVACESWRISDVVKKYGIHQSQLSRALSKIALKWKDLCEQRGLVCEPVVLDPAEMAVVRQLERRHLQRANKRSG